MGFLITVESEDGVPLETVEDASNTIAKLLSHSAPAQLADIDHFGDTTFNRLQVRRFLEQWQRVAVNAKTPEDRALVDRITALATKVRDETHLYLKFYGE